jgi:flagellar protein FliS
MNAQSNAADAYKRATLENAPPIKIVRMLYQGALRFLDEAARMDPAADRPGFQERVHRAEAIVVELRISLEREHAPEVCTELERLYLFVEEQLREAVERQSTAPIAAARNVIETLAGAWRDVEVETARQSGAGEAA